MTHEQFDNSYSLKASLEARVKELEAQNAELIRDLEAALEKARLALRPLKAVEEYLEMLVNRGIPKRAVEAQISVENGLEECLARIKAALERMDT